MSSILVVCSGNLCRSPMAEAILRASLIRRFGSEPAEVSSAGTIAWEGAPATKEAAQVAFENNVDISGHTARLVTQEQIADADLVLTMTAQHREEVADLDPSARTRTFTLKELVRLLEDVRTRAPDGGHDSLTSRIRAADARRAGGPGSMPDDQDIADPIGQPIDTYRAVAWEIATWCERLIGALFGPEDATNGPERPRPD